MIFAIAAGSDSDPPYGHGLIENDFHSLFTFLAYSPVWPVARAENDSTGKLGCFDDSNPRRPA
jgi:hypothetical protein